MPSFVTVDGPSYEGGSNTYEHGSGVYIGDGYILTAGHVAFDYDHLSDSSIDQITIGNVRTSSPAASVNVVYDYKGYQALYAEQVKSTYIYDDSNGIPRADNTQIESEAPLRAIDSVVISGNGYVDQDDFGLVFFINSTDMQNPILSVGSSATITRIGDTTGTVSGNITNASGGIISFDQVSKGGDSGGPYLLNFEGRSYVIGVQSASSSTTAYGTYFSESDWNELNDLISTGQTGDVTSSEPTNMVVGSSSGDNIAGSFRSDILLGGGGSDSIQDGDQQDSPSVWANDTLIGGDGDDVFFAGAGDDTIWGGDEDSPGGVADGTDIVDYSARSKPIGMIYDASNGTPVLSVTDGYGGTDALHSVEKVIGTAGRDTLAIKGAIAADTNLTFDASGGQAPNPANTINARQAGNHISIQIDALGQGYAQDDSTLGKINLQGFHTGIVGSDYGNDINDQSDGYKRIAGGANDDTITIGGNDGGLINGDDGDDSLTGGDGDDTISGGRGGDTLFGGAGSDHLISNNKGNDFDSSPEDELSGGSGADFLEASRSNAILEGGEGNDLIDAEWSESSTVKFGIGDGHDLVLGSPNPFLPSAGSVFGIEKFDLSTISQNDVSFIWSNDASVQVESDPIGNPIDIHGTVRIIGDLTIRVNSTGDSISFRGVTGYASFNGFTYDGHSDLFDFTFRNQLPVEFSDGELNWDSFSSDNPIPIGFGDISAYTTALSDYNSAVADSATHKSATENSDTLWGGGGDDSINAGGGDDTVLSSGGQDIVDGGAGQDALILTGTASQYGITSNDDQSVTFTDTSGAEGAITVKSIESVSFLTDGATGSFHFGTAASDTIVDGSTLILHGGAGDDFLTGGDGGAHIFGGSGDDNLFGGTGSDTLSGGLGNDQLSGGAGGDLYVWTSGDGSDTVIDGSDGSYNTLHLSEIYDDTTIAVHSSGNDVILSFASGETITLKNQLSADGLGGVDAIQFDYLDQWDRQHLISLIDNSGNSAPLALTNPIADSTEFRGQAVDISIPSDTFSGGTGTLTYSATLDDGSALPSWLTLNGDELTGTVPADAIGPMGIKLTANDGTHSVDDVFTLNLAIDTNPLIKGFDQGQVTEGNDRIVSDEYTNVSINGNGGDDYITMDAWNDGAYGGAGNDVIEFFGDNEGAYGDAGSDVFIFDSNAFQPSHPWVTNWGEIEDFTPGTDRVGIMNNTAGVSSFAELQSFMSQSGSDVVINLTGLPTITLAGVNLTSLGASDFMFGSWPSLGGIGAPPTTGVVPYPTIDNTTALDNLNTDDTNDRVLGNGVNNTTVHMYAGDDYITTDGWGVVAYGDRGNDVFEVNGTQNYVSGGPGYDYFIFDSANIDPYYLNDSYWAEIYGFQDGVDKIVIRNGTGGVNNFDELSQFIGQDSDGAVISLAGAPVIGIDNIDPSQLDASDFIFESTSQSEQLVSVQPMTASAPTEAINGPRCPTRRNMMGHLPNSSLLPDVEAWAQQLTQATSMFGLESSVDDLTLKAPRHALSSADYLSAPMQSHHFYQ